MSSLSWANTSYNPIEAAGCWSERADVSTARGGRGGRTRERYCRRRALHGHSRKPATDPPCRVKNKVGASSTWSGRAGDEHSSQELVTLNGRHTSDVQRPPPHPTPHPRYHHHHPRSTLGSNRTSNTHPPPSEMSPLLLPPARRQERLWEPVLGGGGGGRPSLTDRRITKFY